MYRIGLEFLLKWGEKEGRRPLIIRGARQAGKSYLVREYAKTTSLDLLEINLEREPDAVHLFRKDSIQKTLELLSLQYRQKIEPQKTLLFLDEIQAAPDAIPLLRYFHEEKPSLRVIAAGSLLEFTLRDHSFSMPVGRVEYMHLGPMTFEEFLLAADEKDLRDFIVQYQLDETIPVPIHRRLMDRVRTFSIVGGMPEAIKTFLSGSWESCEASKQNILSTYQDDFSKYRDRIPQERLRKLFRGIPLLIGEKFKYVNVDPHERSKDLSNGLDLLCMARVAHRICHTSANGVPLGAEIDQKFFKVLFLDVGLVSSSCGLSLLSVEKESDLNLVNQGRLTEQLVGQHLLYDRPAYETPELYYWTREKKNAAAEIDYLTSLGSQVIPVEVKSGKTGRLRSLHLFLAEKERLLGVRFNSEPPSLLRDRQGSLLSLPLYMIGQWKRLVQKVL